MANWFRTAILLAIGLLAVARPAFAKSGNDSVSFGKDIVVEEGAPAGDLVCMMCSIKVHGDVHGDMVALLGSVEVDDAKSISGDLAVVGGDVSLGENATVNGDVAVVAGDLNTGSNASIGGDRKVMSGRGWLFLPFAPLLIFIGIVWLIVWLVTRRRYRFPMYPQGRGF